MFHTIAVMVLSLAAGILFFWMLSVWLYVSRRDSELEWLEERHENMSQAEVEQRKTILYKINPSNTKEQNEWLWVRYRELEAQHKSNWKVRVRQIVDIAAPISDEEQAELDAGINPYKKQPRKVISR